MTLQELKISLVPMALGGSPLFANNILCFESYHPVNQQLSALLFLGYIIGIKLLPLLVGQVIELHPLILFELGMMSSVSVLAYASLRVMRKRIMSRLKEQDNEALKLLNQDTFENSK